MRHLLKKESTRYLVFSEKRTTLKCSISVFFVSVVGRRHQSLADRRHAPRGLTHLL